MNKTDQLNWQNNLYRDSSHQDSQYLTCNSSTEQGTPSEYIHQKKKKKKKMQRGGKVKMFPKEEMIFQAFG